MYALPCAHDFVTPVTRVLAGYMETLLSDDGCLKTDGKRYTDLYCKLNLDTDFLCNILLLTNNQ